MANEDNLDEIIGFLNSHSTPKPTTTNEYVLPKYRLMQD
jgi:hypothetical protein